MPAFVNAHCKWMELRGLSPRTIYQRRMVIGRLAAFAGPGRPVIGLDKETVAAWRAALRTGPEATSSYITHVTAFYAWCVREGLLLDNPAAGLPVPRLGRMLPRPIGEGELLAAVAGAPPRIRPWLVLAGWAGLRAQEIAWLRRRHVLEKTVPPVIIVDMTSAKGSRERVVPMSDFVRSELLPVLPPTGWAFPRADGQPGPNQPWRISSLCNTYLHESGIPATLHQLRHRFGTQAYLHSKDLRVVQELMGHANPATTAGYAAYSRSDARAAVVALPVPAAAAGPTG